MGNPPAECRRYTPLNGNLPAVRRVDVHPVKHLLVRPRGPVPAAVPLHPPPLDALKVLGVLLHRRQRDAGRVDEAARVEAGEGPAGADGRGGKGVKIDDGVAEAAGLVRDGDWVWGLGG